MLDVTSQTRGHNRNQEWCKHTLHGQCYIFVSKTENKQRLLHQLKCKEKWITIQHLMLSIPMQH